MILGLLGVQAALFSPSKYGILPEILPHEQLSSGNGLMEMWTSLAIIGGTVAGPIIVSITGGWAWLGGMLLAAISATGLIAALGIPRVPAARSDGGLADTFKLAWSAVRADRILRLAIMGQVIVWSIASLVPAPVQAYAMKTLGLPKWLSGFPLAAVGIGIGVGSLTAGRLSASKVEYGLVPLGALGLTLSTLAFALIGPGMAGTMLLMGLVGFSAGLVFVPLGALIQWRSPEDRRGAVIALGNMLVNVGMLAGSILAMVLAVGGLSARGTFLGASVVLAAATLWALWLAPDAALAVPADLAGGHALQASRAGSEQRARQWTRTPDSEPCFVRRRPFRDGHDRSADPVRRLCRVFQAAAPGPFPPHHGGDPDCRPWRPQDDSGSLSRGWPGTRQRRACLHLSGRPNHADRNDPAVPAWPGADRQGSRRADHSRPYRPGDVQRFQPHAEALVAGANTASRDRLVR